MNIGEALLMLTVGLVSGVVSGALGIGGGVIMVPAMVLLLGVQQSVAQGTSLLVILPTALSGAQSHYRRRNLDLRPTIWLGLLGAVTAGVGAYLAVHFDQQKLREVFAVYILLVGIRTIYTGIRKSA